MKPPIKGFRDFIVYEGKKTLLEKKCEEGIAFTPEEEVIVLNELKKYSQGAVFDLERIPKGEDTRYNTLNKIIEHIFEDRYVIRINERQWYQNTPWLANRMLVLKGQNHWSEKVNKQLALTRRQVDTQFDYVLRPLLNKKVWLKNRSYIVSKKTTSINNLPIFAKIMGNAYQHINNTFYGANGRRIMDELHVNEYDLAQLMGELMTTLTLENYN